MTNIPPNYVKIGKEFYHPANVKKEVAQRVVEALVDQVEQLDSKPARKRVRQSGKPLLNVTETRFRDHLRGLGYQHIFEQAITLRLDPPFQSYRPDLAYMSGAALFFVEVKGPHRYREKGIAKVALAAKTYPQFTFQLADWRDGEFRITICTP